MLWEEKLRFPSENAAARALVVDDAEVGLWYVEMWVGDVSPWLACPFLGVCR